MSRKRLIENAMSLGGVQLVNMALPLLALPYLAAKIGADQLGRLAFALSIAQVMTVLTDYGFNLTAAKAVSINRDDKARVAEIWCAVTAIRAVFALAGLVVLLLLGAVLDRFNEHLDLILIAYVMVIGNVLFPQWLFQGLEKVKAVSLVQVVARVIVFGSIFIFVKEPQDLRLAVFLQSAGLLLGGVLAFPHMLRALGGVPLSWPGKDIIVRELRQGWHVFASTSVTNIYTQGNAFFLGLVAAPAVVGHYYIAERLIRATQVMYGPVSNTIFPYISQLVATNRPAAMAFIGKVLRYSGLAGLLMSISICALAPFLVELVFGAENAAVAPLLQVFSPLPFILVVSNTLTIQMMLPLNMQAQLTRIYVLAAVLNLLIFVPFAIYGGAHGAAVANMAVEVFIILLLVRTLRQNGIDVFRLASKNYVTP